ncbi:hypothetical protein LIER_07099 [Lithospermum erythrorhizon]|uniref:Uncharacterized protein n=1 Tax=Lithospermum erythrorhizon TaxID=34254 RepID=A0AAV3P878_LITER
MANPSDEFRLVSSNIDHEGRLPRKYTAEGQGAALKNMSPPLEWYNIPEGTKSLALIVELLDAPEPSSPLVPWTVWVVVNIPPTLKGLPEGFSGKGEELGGDYVHIKEGNSDEKVPGWRGPLMPSEEGHRFEFKLYALDEELHLGKKVTKDKVLEAIEDHVLGEAVLVAIGSRSHHDHRLKRPQGNISHTRAFA